MDSKDLYNEPFYMDSDPTDTIEVTRYYVGTCLKELVKEENAKKETEFDALFSDADVIRRK